MASILSRPQWVNSVSLEQVSNNFNHIDAAFYYYLTEFRRILLGIKQKIEYFLLTKVVHWAAIFQISVG